MGTLKPQSNGPLYSNTVIGTPYTHRWWADCYIWYSEEGPGLAGDPPSPLIALPHVTAHPSTSSVPTSYCSMWHCFCTVKVKLFWGLNTELGRSTLTVQTLPGSGNVFTASRCESVCWSVDLSVSLSEIVFFVRYAASNGSNYFKTSKERSVPIPVQVPCCVTYCGIRTFPRRHIPAPDIFPSRIIPPPFSHGVEHFPLPPSHHPPIYNVRRSNVNVYNIDSGRSVRVRSTGWCHISKKILTSLVG